MVEKSASRKQRSAATREAIMAAALRLFSSLGYTATTMKAIADEAGFAVQTVYFVFHTKSDLLSAVIESTAAGQDDPPAVMTRPWAEDALAASDARRTIALTVDHGVDIYERTAPLTHAIREAALVESDVDVIWTNINVKRKAGMARLLHRIADRGALKQGLNVERATDIMHSVNSHDTYLQLVQASGWSLAEYKAWLYTSLCDLLLRPEVVNAPGAEEVIADRSFVFGVQ